MSNGLRYEEASKGQEADQKLINYLVKHRHGTPFEHATFQFFVKAPLFVRSEWHRHRMASYNEISGRYVEYEPGFYIPEFARIKAATNKQGSLVPERISQVESPTEWNSIRVWNHWVKEEIEEISLNAYRAYKVLLEEGVAKEMARMILPLNLYTQFYVTINARSLMNFLSLRAAEDAQWEIRQYAIAMKEMFKEAMPLTYNAWEANNYIAP